MNHVLVEPIMKFVPLLIVTNMLCNNIREVTATCIDFQYSTSEYNYKVWPGTISLMNATELANRERGSLLVIEDRETEQLVYNLMRLCNITQAWLGIQVIPTHMLLTDSEPWSWVSDCDKEEDEVISFQGCYIENINDRDLPVDSGLTSDDVTGDKCMEQCRRLGQKYAGIQPLTTDVYSCYCGQSYGKYGSDTGCSYTCPEDTSHSCGASGRNSVYHTSITTFWGNWVESFPVYNHALSYCAYISKNILQHQNYLLKNDNCNKQLTYMCQRKENETVRNCDSQQGFIDFGPRDNMCYYIGTEKLVWHKAKYSCSELGGKLASIRNTFDHAVIKGWLRFVSGDKFKDIWVGAARKTFRRLDSNGPVCYTKFNGRLRRSGNVYIEAQGEQLQWTITDNSEESSFSLATAITQHQSVDDATVLTPVFPTEQPTNRPTVTTPERTSEQPTERPTQSTPESTSEQPIERPTQSTAERTSEQPTERSAQSTPERISEQPTERPTQSTPESTSEQPTERPTQSTPARTSEQPTEQSTERTTEQLTERPTQSTAERTAEFTTEQPTERVTEPNEHSEAGEMRRSTETPSNEETVTPNNQEIQDEERGLSAGIMATIIAFCLLLFFAICGALVLFCKNQKAAPKAVRRRSVLSSASKRTRKNNKNGETWSTYSGDRSSLSYSGDTRSTSYSEDTRSISNSRETGHISESTTTGSNSEMSEAIILNMLPNLKRLTEKMNSRDKTPQENMQNASSKSETNIHAILSTVGKMSTKTKAEILQDANQKWHIKTSIESDLIISDSSTTESSISKDAKESEEPKRTSSSVDKLPKSFEDKK